MPSLNALMSSNPAVKWGLIVLLVVGAYFAVRWIIDELD